MNPNPDSPSGRLPWQELELQAAPAFAPNLAARILAETARLRAEAVTARENARVMVMSAFALSLVLLGYVEFNGWSASSTANARVDEWKGLAQWVETLE
ncbi:hypothetical protein SAMN05444156_0755 [Verrucomicrobium sp. GAS474]|uniref:hypothetical protein n=1 Tax=Verrucomicrobium sp. GAS474 TaxID=1882831 RepID=UPI00087C7987|nr:hypothetical protein [Verrucomicrobium sp. GAS474]SDT92091.1 hypothetical protein SAMN05444156_0755 [Verrucomicrobium sp. GAS474]